MKNLFHSFVFVFLAITPAVAADQASAQSEGPYGIAAKRPVFAGACHHCPWGAIGDVVKGALKPYGYDVQMCYECASTLGPRQVSEARIPQPFCVAMADFCRERGITPQMIQQSTGPAREALPKGPVDFGSTSTQNLRRAYEGRLDYAKDGPRRNYRVFGVVDYPNYLLVAATKESGITNLAQLRGRTAPLRVLVGNQPQERQVLSHYGWTEDSIKAAGGSVRHGGANTTTDFDLLIFGGTLSNAPEQAIWYAVTQKRDMVFLQMPEDLIAQLANDPDYERRTVPLGLLRGLDKNISTVARRANAIYGRDDAPDDFAYTVAKALDEQQDLWMWAPISLYYNPKTAWKTLGLPLHPGAERYYREMRYMK